jgi:microcystin-dependent protein
MAHDGMLGEIRMFSYGTMPDGWVPCNGQTLQITKNEALWSILGPTYGGNGQTTFALPDLRGRTTISREVAADVGKMDGEEAHALTPGEMPVHRHTVFGSDGAANSAAPAGRLWANRSGKNPFSTQVSQGAAVMSGGSISFEGSGEKHENMSPYLAVNFGICVSGIFGGRDGTIGELMMYAGFPQPDQPKDWKVCEGQLLALSQNTALFSLLGTYYGGNGTSTFALPDLRKVAPIHCGQGNGLTERELGERGGSATVTLNDKQLAQHTHTAKAINDPATTNVPSNNVWAMGGGDVRGGVPFYTSDGKPVGMNAEALSNAGGGKPHNNMPPYLTITFLICTAGKFPVRG